MVLLGVGRGRLVVLFGVGLGRLVVLGLGLELPPPPCGRGVFRPWLLFPPGRVLSLKNNRILFYF